MCFTDVLRMFTDVLQNNRGCYFMKKIKWVFVFFVIVISFVSVTCMFADGDKYTYTKKSILNDTDDKKVYDTNSSDYIFEYGLELLNGAMYEEAIKKFNELRVRFPGKAVSKMSHIYEGIARVRMGLDNNSRGSIREAILKYHYIAKELPEFLSTPSEDLTLFYVSLSEASRKYNMIDFSLQGYMEYATIFFNSKIKNALITEIGYMHYFRGNFYSAIGLFLRSSTKQSKLGLAKSYTAIGEINKAIAVCEKLKKVSSGDDLVKLNKYYSYIKSIKDTTPSGDPYSVNYNNKTINGNYKIFVGYFSDKDDAIDVCNKLISANYAEFTVNVSPDGEGFHVSSSAVMEYKDAKRIMESIINYGYTNAFIKDVSF